MNRIHLLSCGACCRQLDVTALDVGDVVQCVCDTVLTVPIPKKVQVRGLSCGRCGGALGENETSCSFCSAMLAPHERKETLLCPVCAVRLPEDSRHCKGCGVELRVTALPPLPREGKCPRCDSALRVHLMDEAEVIECSPTTGCGGLWCSRDTFERLQRNSRQAAVSGSATSPPPSAVGVGATMEHPGGAQADRPLRQYVPCLTCGDLMQRKQFRVGGRPSPIVIDVCGDHGVWFDEGELESALELVRARMTIGDPMQRTTPSTITRSPRPQAPTSSSKRSVAATSIEAVLDLLAGIFTFSLFD